MKTSKSILLALGMTLAAQSSLALAATDSRLTCDADTFEAPMSLVIHGNHAEARVSWDEAGSAIMQADYRDLAVYRNGAELNVVEHVAPGRRPRFHLALRKTSNGSIEGKLFVVSNDGQNMDFTGEISCK